MKYSLTEKQQEGLDICLKRYKDKKPYTIIAGYARHWEKLSSKSQCR